jgi:uncharacterized protein (TIGR02466 family)
MPGFSGLFATQLHETRLAVARGLADTCLAIAAEDKAGRRWAKSHGYGGYTSYASLDDLTKRATVFADLESVLAKHVAAFANHAQFDLGRRKLTLDSLWINVMNRAAVHAPHIHPHSVVSGTYYVTVPPGSGAIRFEDPRLAMLMAAPPKKPNARLENRTFVDVTPKAGMLLLWESWLRHGVERHAGKTPRISISFNYS